METVVKSIISNRVQTAMRCIVLEVVITPDESIDGLYDFEIKATPSKSSSIVHYSGYIGSSGDINLKFYTEDKRIDYVEI